MPTLTVFSRRGCHLCELLIEELQPLVRGVLSIAIQDVDSRADWRRRYGDRIPVVEFDGEPVCEAHLDRAAIARVLQKLQREPQQS